MEAMQWCAPSVLTQFSWPATVLARAPEISAMSLFTSRWDIDTKYMVQYCVYRSKGAVGHENGDANQMISPCTNVLPDVFR